MLQAGFELKQNMSKGFLELSGDKQGCSSNILHLKLQGLFQLQVH